MTEHDQQDRQERLLTLEEVAERRITFHKVGRYVRFTERDIAAYLAAARVQARPATPRELTNERRSPS